ncbi:MAG TPA: TIGR00730 family Rossman fold protein [Candidatus Obscuribacterales bacterium]
MTMTLCIFCGALPGIRPAYRQAAERLGCLLAERQIAIVYGGGRVGLMGALADAALAAGGRVTGIIPRALFDRELGHNGVTELRIVGSMHERKAMMEELSDGFIALPGGFGTFEEIFEMITWLQLGVHGKPCALLNIEGYFDALAGFVEHASAEGFITSEDRDLLLVDDDPERLLDRVLAYRAPAATKWLALEQT